MLSLNPFDPHAPFDAPPEYLARVDAESLPMPLFRDSDIERQKAERRAQRAATYAKRFAAKEACAKALGTGIRHGVYWRDIGVVNAPGGRPTIVLSGGALRRLSGLVPDGHEARIDLTLTDEFPIAEAVVIITAIPIKADLRG